MHPIKHLWLYLIILLAISSCKTDTSSINLEQVNSEAGQKLIAPGLGSLGIIHNQKVYVYYLNESHKWILDKVSQFLIPEPNQGLLAMGMGIIGVVNDGNMKFYYLDAENQWKHDTRMTMDLPGRYQQINSMRIPWQMGFVAIEEPSGVISFYYLDENNLWTQDETARFHLPENTDDYLMLGNMKVGIIYENKLGVYELGDEGEWQFLDDMVLALPANTESVISFEAGTIAVLENNILHFYDLDPANRTWIRDNAMAFRVPDF